MQERPHDPTWQDMMNEHGKRQAKIDALVPPEEERSFEQLLAELPTNLADRLKHAQMLLTENTVERNSGGNSAMERVTRIADVVNVLNDYRAMAFHKPSPVTIPEPDWRAYLAGLHPSADHWKSKVLQSPIARWLGTDAAEPEVAQKIGQTIFNVAVIMRTYYLAISKIIPRSPHTPEYIILEKMVHRDAQLRQEAFDELKTIEAHEPPAYLSSFPDTIRDTLLANTFAVELTEGCSVRCTFCAFDAAKGVRDIMPFDKAIWLLRRINPFAFLYYATDPLDYRVIHEGKERTYRDLVDVSTALRGTRPFTATAYPKDSTHILQSLAHSIERISISNMNEKRLIRDGFIEKTAGGTLLPKDPNIAWRFWNVIASLDRGPIEIYRIGSDAKKHEMVYTSGRQRARSHEEGHAQGDEVADSIACRDGILLSTNKAKNSVRMMTTDRYPNGVAEGILTPEMLNDGFAHVERIAAEVNLRKKVHIEDFLPYVALNFAHSFSVPNTLAQGRGTPFEQTVTFSAFSKASSKAWGSCTFDRISGVISRIALGQPE